MKKTLKPGETGTVLVAEIDSASVVTRDLSDTARSRAAIEDYAEAYRTKATMPPVEVFLVGGAMVLVDGYHRVGARVLLGEIGVVANCVGKGTLDDALRHALSGTNRTHGLRLSPADCKRRVEQALDSGLWDTQPASVLAKDLGIHRETVSKYMAAWEAASSRELPPVVDSAGRVQPRRKPRRDVVDSTTSPAADVGVDNDDFPEEETGPIPGDGTPLDDQPVTAEPLPPYGAALGEAAKGIASARLASLRAIEAAPLSLRQSVERHLKAAEGALKTAIPLVCERCTGEGCNACGKRGWTTRIAGAA